MTSRQLVQLIVRILDEKKAQNIEVIQIGDLSTLGEYFVIADTDNATHVKSLVEELEFQAKQRGILPRLVEKDSGSSWIVLDYQEVIVHIFHKKTREFYDLERLWADGKRLEVESLFEEGGNEDVL